MDVTPTDDKKSPATTWLMSIGFVVLVLGFLAPMFWSSSPAEPALDSLEPSTNPKQHLSLQPMLLQLFFAFGFVGVVIIGIFLFWKATQTKAEKKLQGPLQILGGTTIPPHGSLIYIRLGKRRILAGIDNFGFRTLTLMPNAPTTRIEVAQATVAIGGA